MTQRAGSLYVGRQSGMGGECVAVLHLNVSLDTPNQALPKFRHEMQTASETTIIAGGDLLA